MSGFRHNHPTSLISHGGRSGCNPLAFGQRWFDSIIRYMKKLVLSVTLKDCDVQTFRSGGPGGQHQNKVSSGVRVTHRASGAVGEAREQRSQLQNKRTAFIRMTQTPKFQTWMRLALGRDAVVDSQVQESMKPENLKVEGIVNGEWRRID